MKPISIIFVNKSLEDSYFALAEGDDKDRKLHSEIRKVVEKLKADRHGIKIPRKLWPAEYVDITNLWKFNLRNGWRVVYTIKEEDVVILNVLLEYFKSHKEYEKRFKY